MVDFAKQMERMKLQRAEFDALNKLIEQQRRHSMTAVVDDDYPEIRHDFEGAMADYMRAIFANRGPDYFKRFVQ